MSERKNGAEYLKKGGKGGKGEKKRKEWILDEFSYKLAYKTFFESLLVMFMQHKLIFFIFLKT